MNKFIIGGAVLILVVIGIIAGIILLTQPTHQVSTSSVTFPESADSLQQDAAAIPQVKQTFTNSIQNSDQITLKNTTVVLPYALQVWGDTNKGGEALLKYDSTKGWILVSLGGGAWDVPSLVQEGVPQATAQKLISKSQ